MYDKDATPKCQCPCECHPDTVDDVVQAIVMLTSRVSLFLAVNAAANRAAGYSVFGPARRRVLVAVLTMVKEVTDHGL